VNIFKAATLLVPSLDIGYNDETRHNKVAATWTDQEGYRSTYGVEFRTVHNSERIAVERGVQQPDGSFIYVAPNGSVHVCTKERYDAIARMQCEQAMHQQYRRNPHQAHYQQQQEQTYREATRNQTVCDVPDDVPVDVTVEVVA